MRMTRSPSRVALMCVAWLAILLLTTSVSGFVILEVSTSAAPTERADIYKGYQAAIGTYSTSFTLSSSVVAAGAGAGAAVVAAAGAVSAAAVIGLYDDAAIASVPNKLGSYVLFGPYPQSLAVRQWSNQLYFMTADPTGELLSLLNQAVIRDIAGTTAMGTVGWMYLKGVAGATTEPLSTTFYAQINQLGYNTPVAYTADAGSAFTSAATFLALKPTSIFIFGERGAHTTAFVAAVGASPVSSGTGFTAFAPFALLNSISGGSGSLTASKMVFTSLVPPPKSTTLATASAAAFTTAITASNTGMAGTYLASVSGLYAFHGWIAMMQAIYAVNLYGSTTGLNTASLQTALFMQNRYVIGNDYILGDYGGSCGNSVVGVATGTACQCNQGGHYVAVITVAGGAVTMVNEKNYPLYDCYISGTAEGTAPLRVSMFGLTDVTALNYIYTQMNNGFTAVSAAGAAATYQLQSQMTMKYASMATATTATAATTLTTQATNFMSVVSGPLPSGFSPATYPNILFLEPIFADSGALSLTLNNVIYVTATLEQQIYIMSSYIADRIKAIPKPKPGAANNQQQTELRTVNAVVRTANPATLFKLIESSVNQFGLPLNNQTVATTATDNMVDELGENGFFFVIGILSNEIPDLLTFMTKNLDVVVFLCFNDITLQYATFESTFKSAPNAVTRRLFFVTDIITWSATTNAADIVEKYLSTAGTTYQTPAGARGFLAAVALDRATAGIPNANAQTIFNNFMNVQSFSIGNNAYGPYHSNCFTAPSDYPSACLKNYGARNMALMQWRNLQDLNYPLPILRSSPSLVYTAGIVTTTTTTTTTLPPCTHRPRTRKPAPKHSGMIAGLIFLCLLLLLLLLLVLWLCWISCFCCASTDSQNVKAAPTDATKPVTMAYISVYKWSEVSSAAPEAASQAISDVRNLVRRVVAKNNCYEVGTLNDAFIVAARVAMNGVQMAIDLQNGLRELGGAGQADIDRAYYSILKEGPGSGKGAMHGLRLRVGLHTDQVDIKMDRATGVYQYRGPGVILSAFTSRLAHGGQILLTENTCNSLTELELTKLDTLPIGAHKYPDMNEPVNVYEVVAVPGRKHPAARPETVPTHTADLLSELPLVCATFKDAEDEETSANTGQLNKTIQVVLRILYSTFPAADRVELLQHLCREASLKELKRPTNASDEDFSNALIDLLAMRAATFVITAADVTRATGNMDAMNATTPGKGVETFSPNGTEMHQYEDPQKPPQQDEYSYPTDNNDERAGGHNAPLADVSDATSDSSMFHL